MPAPLLYSIRETGRLLGISRPTIYRLIAAGHLVALKIGNATRIPANEIDRRSRRGHSAGWGRTMTTQAIAPIIGGGPAAGAEPTVYQASPIKQRRRATRGEMEERADFLIAYANEHGPVTVRGLYYQAEVHGIPGIDKDDRGYAKVQRQVLNLRREGRLAYSDIADATRWMRKPTTHDGIEDALRDTARFYRKALWRDAAEVVEIWCEKDALAGVIYPVTDLYDVPLMVTRGFSSETFCFEAAEARERGSPAVPRLLPRMISTAPAAMPRGPFTRS